MTPELATFLYAGLIVGLFWATRDREDRSSAALWLPVLWVALACSRSVAQWLQMAPLMDSSSQIPEGSPLDRAVYTGLLAAGLLVLVGRGGRTLSLLRANVPIALFFVYCLLSLFWSEFPGVGFKRWTKALGDFVMVMIVLSDAHPAAAVRRLLTQVAFIVVPLSVLFIKYYPQLGRVYGEWDYKAYYTGVTTNKNTLGAICLYFGLASLWWFTETWSNKEGARRTQRLIAYGILLAMTLWLLYIADSMTSLSCFLLALPVLFAANRSAVRRKPTLLHILVLSAICVALTAEFVAPYLLTFVNRNATLTDRTGLWKLALSLHSSPLLGAGFESFWLGPRLAELWRVFTWGPEEAHNGYLEVYLQLGVPGVILLGVVLVSGYRALFGAWRRNNATAGLMLAYFTVGIIYNCTEAAFFRMMAPAWIFMLLAITSLPHIPGLKRAVRVNAGKASVRSNPERELLTIAASSTFARGGVRTGQPRALKG